ncbi:LOW QUALITY PROTEIN: uncharacterized protein LOC123011972 [Tribolium madens]|uniref:LOW QUALITY PROTEIN: uncharacterized protein LOC123011972 n=1 Tax=Tribolium madens TaxID=41895 RepID=UPI001CF74738|nr:LOW QUALITY PROTEIN: uncharacterized protein LOC123011972 [Tribolium madens]
MTSAVPAILKYLSDSSNYNIDQNMEAPVRAKKRRLDHLTWEEKLQRKKLKNRVAAQTSRDRKKAKMDQMEKALQELFSKNEVLVEECERLKSLNERLSAENATLRGRFSACSCPQSRSVECESASGSRVPSSAARNTHTFSSGSEPPTNGTVEDCAGLPSLPDLLDELNSDVDISSLEQLTQSLLQDIARDLEAAAEKADIQEQTTCHEDSPRQVVGAPPEQLESDGSEVLNENQDPLIKDISQYLLLHHNYSARPPTEENQKAPRHTSTTRVKKLDKLAPDVVYGTYDESTNCITIIVDDEGVGCGSPLTSTEDEEHLTVETSVGGVSPRSSSSSDCGYESLGSPESLWDDSVSELFPSLL